MFSFLLLAICTTIIVPWSFRLSLYILKNIAHFHEVHTTKLKLKSGRLLRHDIAIPELTYYNFDSFNFKTIFPPWKIYSSFVSDSKESHLKSLSKTEPGQNRKAFVFPVRVFAFQLTTSKPKSLKYRACNSFLQ